MAKYVLSTNADVLADFISGIPSATVEAEYGDRCVSGSEVTLAHHGSRKANPCPCLRKNEKVQPLVVVGGSHFDLDFLGGALSLDGFKPESDTFWQLAAFVDVNGAHKLAQSGASPEDVRRLYAFWAWSQANRVLAPRDGSILDVTDKVMEGCKILERVLADDADLLAQGDAMREAEAHLNQSTFRELRHGVVVRVAEVFVNHLYLTPTGEVGKICVTLNTKTNGITVSLADPIEGVSAVKIVQELWGAEAGGHVGIAGSPRNQQMTKVDLENAVNNAAGSLIFG